MSKTGNTRKAEATAQDLNELFTAIAKRQLFIQTLETQKSDGLDFHDCAVWGIKAALADAYNAGLAAGAVAALNGRQGK